MGRIIYGCSYVKSLCLKIRWAELDAPQYLINAKLNSLVMFLNENSPRLPKRFRVDSSSNSRFASILRLGFLIGPCGRTGSDHYSASKEQPSSVHSPRLCPPLLPACISFFLFFFFNFSQPLDWFLLEALPNSTCLYETSKFCDVTNSSAHGSLNSWVSGINSDCMWWWISGLWPFMSMVVLVSNVDNWFMSWNLLYDKNELHCHYWYCFRWHTIAACETCRAYYQQGNWICCLSFFSPF